jgi:hypothetical protein
VDDEPIAAVMCRRCAGDVTRAEQIARVTALQVSDELFASLGRTLEVRAAVTVEVLGVEGWQ